MKLVSYTLLFMFLFVWLQLLREMEASYKERLAAEVAQLERRLAVAAQQAAGWCFDNGLYNSWSVRRWRLVGLHLCHVIGRCCVGHNFVALHML